MLLQLPIGPFRERRVFPDVQPACYSLEPGILAKRLAAPDALTKSFRLRLKKQKMGTDLFFGLLLRRYEQHGKPGGGDCCRRHKCVGPRVWVQAFFTQRIIPSLPTKEQHVSSRCSCEGRQPFRSGCIRFQRKKCQFYQRLASAYRAYLPGGREATVSAEFSSL